MRKIKYNPERFDNEKMPLKGFLMHDYDSYWEYYEFIYPRFMNTKQIVSEGYSISDSMYHLVKQELEHIFSKPGDITWELLDEYNSFWNKRLSISRIVAKFLAIYCDYYKEDEEFDKKLYESTKEYFGITEDDIEKTRI